jgi:hypothetical protein
MGYSEFYRGNWGAVALAVLEDGSCPAREFIESLSEGDLMKLLALLKRAADMGPININNREKFKKLENDLFEFKVFQIRIPCFYDGRSIVLTHGFKKKQDDIPPAEIKRARRIKDESTQANKSSQKKRKK